MVRSCIYYSEIYPRLLTAWRKKVPELQQKSLLAAAQPSPISPHPSLTHFTTFYTLLRRTRPLIPNVLPLHSLSSRHLYHPGLLRVCYSMLAPLWHLICSSLTLLVLIRCCMENIGISLIPVYLMVAAWARPVIEVFMLRVVRINDTQNHTTMNQQNGGYH